MLSSYGFQDGSGIYYIQIDTDQCSVCDGKPCVSACPAKLFEIFEDDDDEEVVRIREDVRNKLKDECVVCKSRDDTEGKVQVPLCVQACPNHALKHTW